MANEPHAASGQVPPVLNTPRLRLRLLEESDLPDLVKWVNHPVILDNILNFPNPYSLEDAAKRLAFVQQGFAEGARFVFAIVSLESGTLIGEIGLHPDREHNRAEVGFWLAEPWWNQGLMAEALQAVVDFGFGKVGLHKIQATHYPDNPASGRVLAKAGMQVEGMLREHYRVGAGYRSVVLYGMVRGDWKGSS